MLLQVSPGWAAGAAAVARLKVEYIVSYVIHNEELGRGGWRTFGPDIAWGKIKLLLEALPWVGVRGRIVVPLVPERIVVSARMLLLFRVSVILF